VAVQQLTTDVFAIAYKVTERLIVDGQELTLVANDASVWMKRGGGWVCSLHTESPAGDPFGRDRHG
jgi:hypothetical protein